MTRTAQECMTEVELSEIRERWNSPSEDEFDGYHTHDVIELAALDINALIAEIIRVREMAGEIFAKATAYDLRYGNREEIRKLQGQVHVQSDRIIQLERELDVAKAVHSSEGRAWF